MPDHTAHKPFFQILAKFTEDKMILICEPKFSLYHVSC